VVKCKNFCAPGLSVLILFLGIFVACKPAETTIPVNVQYASEVGSLHFEIVYDSVNYKAIRVDRSDSFTDILLESDINTPGHIIVGVVSGGGINGDGTIATVVLQAKKSGTDSTTTLENVIAYNTAATVELPVKVSMERSNGSSLTAAVIEFLPTTE
jgi:hypothetical protein